MLGQGNFHVQGGAAAQATGSNAVKASSGGALSKDFIQALQKQMGDWITAISDSKVTPAEISTIQSGGDLNALSEASDAEGMESAASYLYASSKINDVANLMSFLFTYQSKLNEMAEKAEQLLRG